MLHGQSRVGERRVRTRCATSPDSARTKCGVGAPSRALAHAKSGLGARQVLPGPVQGVTLLPSPLWDLLLRHGGIPRAVPPTALGPFRPGPLGGAKPHTKGVGVQSLLNLIDYVRLCPRLSATWRHVLGALCISTLCLQIHWKLTAVTAFTTTTTRSRNTSTATAARAALCLLQRPFHLLTPLVQRLLPPPPCNAPGLQNLWRILPSLLLNVKMRLLCQGVGKSLSRACQGLGKGLSRACQGLSQGLCRGPCQGLVKRL